MQDKILFEYTNLQVRTVSKDSFNQMLLLLFFRNFDHTSRLFRDVYDLVLKCIIVSYELHKLKSLVFICYLSPDSSTSCLIGALVPYHSHLLLLLNHVAIVGNLCFVEALMVNNVYLISTLINKDFY